MAQQIRTWTPVQLVLCSNPLVIAVVPLGKAVYLHCLVPQRGLKTIGPLVADSQAA